MFKKIVLVGILLLLLPSMISAAILSDLVQQGAVVQVVDDKSQLLGDLWVWLEVPEDLPAPGKTFWVDLYITPIQTNFKKTLTLVFKPSNNKVKFTGYVAGIDSEIPYFKIMAGSILNPNDGSIHLSRFFQNNWQLLSGDTNLYKQKIYIGRLEMLVNSQGSFQISLVKAESEAWYSDLDKYTLKQGNTRILRNSHCISNPSPCSGKCGAVDNGCGGIVTCSGCASDKICVNNACVSAVSQLPADSQSACQAIISTPAAGDKVLLQTIGETLQDWGKSCTTNTDCKAGYSCVSNACTATELSILSPIFAAIKGWLGSKFP